MERATRIFGVLLAVASLVCGVAAWGPYSPSGDIQASPVTGNASLVMPIAFGPNGAIVTGTNNAPVWSTVGTAGTCGAGCMGDLGTAAQSVYIGVPDPNAFLAGGYSVFIGTGANYYGGTAPQLASADMIAIGEYPTVRGFRGTAIGAYTMANGERAIAIGGSNTVAGTYSVALGPAANANAPSYGCATCGSVAIGHLASTGLLTNSTAIGPGATANANNQIMLGTSAETVTVPGTVTLSSGPGRIDFGSDATGSSSAQQAVLLGNPNAATYATAGAQGYNYGYNAIVIGSGAQVMATGSADRNIAIGAQALIKSVAGAPSNGSAFRNTVVGLNAAAQGYRNACYGNGANASGIYNIAIGDYTSVGDTYNTGLVQVSNSTAIGKSASAQHSNSTALGVSATTTAANQVMLGTASETVVLPGLATLVGNANFNGASTTLTPVGAVLQVGSGTADAAGSINFGDRNSGGVMLTKYGAGVNLRVLAGNGAAGGWGGFYAGPITSSQTVSASTSVITGSGTAAATAHGFTANPNTGWNYDTTYNALSSYVNGAPGLYVMSGGNTTTIQLGNAGSASAGGKIYFGANTGTNVLLNQTGSGILKLQRSDSAAAVFETGYYNGIAYSGQSSSQSFTTNYHAYTITVQNANYSVVNLTDSDHVVTNTGAGAQVLYTLSATATVGVNYIIVNDTAFGLSLKASGSDIIRFPTPGSDSAAAGTQTTTTLGATVNLMKLKAGLWVAIGAPSGTWTAG